MVVAPRQTPRANVPRFFFIFLLHTVSLKLVSSWLQSPGSLHRSSHHSSIVRPINMASRDDIIVCSQDTQNAFRGKNVLLTGASGGLGHAFALQLAHCGVKTLVLSARRETSLQDVARECQEISSSTTIHCITCDLNKPDSVTQLGKESLKVCNDVIDILINNGGVSSRSRFLDTKQQVDQMVMQINFLSGASLAKAVVPGMVDRNSGAIIWISSVQGLFGLPERTSYAASKFAVQGYCEALRAELASSGVQVHVASPGYIRTNLSRSAITGDGSTHGKLDSTTANGES